MERYRQISDMVAAMEADFQKFYDKNNAAAGTRVRKALQDLKNIAQEVRLEVQNQKNTAGADEAATPTKAAGTAKAAAPKAAAGKGAAASASKSGSTTKKSTAKK